MARVDLMKRMLPALAIALYGCSTTVNMSVPQPNLQTLNLGMPGCAMDCHTTQTATQSIGPGDVQGATISSAITEHRSVGGGN